MSPKKIFNKLGQLVDLGLAQELAHRQHARVILHRDRASADVGTVLQHGGKLVIA
jgi:hypothetical protein